MFPAEDMVLRDVDDSDLYVLFEQQRDPEANWMAAFVSRDPSDRDAYLTHWRRVLADPTATLKAIVRNGELVGSVDWEAVLGTRYRHKGVSGVRARPKDTSPLRQCSTGQRCLDPGTRKMRVHDLRLCKSIRRCARRRGRRGDAAFGDVERALFKGLNEPGNFTRNVRTHEE